MAREHTSSKPIGIFDSGLGGLTVAHSICNALPNETILYVGDTKRCPYGMREEREVRRFVRQVGAWLEKRDVKFVIIACNTATAAGLDVLQKQLSVPVVGVIVPGARAAVQSTFNRKVGVLATQTTVSSGSYVRAIHAIDAGVQVFQSAASELVDIVEGELATGKHGDKDWDSRYEIFDTPRTREIVESCVEPLRREGVDTVVLGCTHFPLLKPFISQALGPEVEVVSSARETCRELKETLARRGELAPSPEGAHAVDVASLHRFATTSEDLDAFTSAGSFVFGRKIEHVEHIVLDELEALTPADATGFIK